MNQDQFEKFIASTKYSTYTGTASCDMSKTGGLEELLLEKGVMNQSQKLIEFTLFNKSDGFGLSGYLIEKADYETLSQKFEQPLKKEDFEKFEVTLTKEELSSKVELNIELSWKGLLSGKTKPQ